MGNNMELLTHKDHLERQISYLLDRGYSPKEIAEAMVELIMVLEKTIKSDYCLLCKAEKN